MITARTARNKGRSAENALATWLQSNGYPDAERSASKLEDRGDIAGVPGCAIQCKHYADAMRGLREAQAGAVKQAMGRRPVAVVRLRGMTDPALWWAATPTLYQPGLCPTHHPLVGDRCTETTLRSVLSWRGGCVRDGWWVTTVESLFRALEVPS